MSLKFTVQPGNQHFWSWRFCPVFLCQQSVHSIEMSISLSSQTHHGASLRCRWCSGLERSERNWGQCQPQQTSRRMERDRKKLSKNSTFTPAQGWLLFMSCFSPPLVCFVLLTLHSSFMWSSWWELGDYQDHKVGWHHFVILKSLVIPEPILKNSKQKWVGDDLVIYFWWAFNATYICSILRSHNTMLLLAFPLRSTWIKHFMFLCAHLVCPL